MQYPFYQRLKQLQHLVHITDMALPEDTLEWHVPFPIQGDQALIPHVITAGDPNFRWLTYRKIRTQAGDLFVADVDCLIESH